MKSQPKSQILNPPAATPEAAAHYFNAKGAYETDVADVAYDLREDLSGFKLIDVRDSRSYEEAHLPGAISFLLAESVQMPFSPEKKFLCYTAGVQPVMAPAKQLLN